MLPCFVDHPLGGVSDHSAHRCNYTGSSEGGSGYEGLRGGPGISALPSGNLHYSTYYTHQVSDIKYSTIDNVSYEMQSSVDAFDLGN